mmetsp:Transcript_6891/g.7693  ORF Transcript_6891/g.7693 Transcript_6891/m.7693 type:complete len:127 (+) Transcript_6891:2-382(+)
MNLSFEQRRIKDYRSIKPINRRINQNVRGIGGNAAFLSNAKRMLNSSADSNLTPGPGNYAQYSSLQSPLVFPYGGSRENYILYENGKMRRKMQIYAADKRKSERTKIDTSFSPGPGEYDINSSSFK